MNNDQILKVDFSKKKKILRFYLQVVPMLDFHIYKEHIIFGLVCEIPKGPINTKRNSIKFISLHLATFFAIIFIYNEVENTLY